MKKTERYKKFIAFERLMGKTHRMKESELIEEAETLYAEKVKREKMWREKKRKLKAAQEAAEVAR